MRPLASERHADKQARLKLIKRAAAAAAAHRIIEQHDWTWSNLIDPPEPQPAIEQRQRYQTCHPRNVDLDLAVQHAYACLDWEKNFVHSTAMERSLSAKQRLRRENRAGTAHEGLSMSADFLKVSQRVRMDEMIARAAATSHVGHVELLRAARDGVINLAFLDRHADAPMKVLERAARPVVVVVGDDDYRSSGPSNWPAWKRLKYWAKATLVHASGADAEAYGLAVAMVLIQLRMLPIETDSEHAHQWGDALCKSGIKTVGLLPRDGEHPVPPAKGTFND